ncbi:MAG: hypothetical protein IJE97_05685, partial [Thermoguttaceae bacterium]|nr:hypothetical protein [Thermoguttaceae bacterium]
MTLLRSFFAARPRFRRSSGVSFFSVFAAAFLASSLFFFFFATAAASDSAAASSPAPSSTPDSASAAASNSSFRFWMAPADKIDRWPWGDEKYYPIRVETFDDWLRA